MGVDKDCLCNVIDGYTQIEMIGIKIHLLSIQTSVISRHLGLPLQGDLDGYSKAFLDLGPRQITSEN